MFKRVNLGRIATYLPHYLVETKAKDGRVHLTFDDGIHAEVLTELLDILAQYDVKATFFVIGRKLKLNMDIAKHLILAGHRLGNHSYYHKDFFRLPLNDQWYEIAMTEELIVEAGGTGGLFRAPQGKIDPFLLLKLRRSGIRAVHWNFDSKDYSRDLNVVNTIFSAHVLQANDIVLMHDDYNLCCDLLKQWLPRWLDQGLQFGTL